MKGQMSLFGLEKVVLGLVVVGILLGAGVYAMLSFSAYMPANSAAQNATNTTATIVSGIGTNWLPILIVMVMVGIILAILMRWSTGA